MDQPIIALTTAFEHPQTDSPVNHHVVVMYQVDLKQEITHITVSSYASRKAQENGRQSVGLMTQAFKGAILEGNVVQGLYNMLQTQEKNLQGQPNPFYQADPVTAEE